MRGSRGLWRRSKYGDEVVVEGGGWIVEMEAYDEYDNGTRQLHAPMAMS
jgi:hypothetical protein